jgi:hypothetical protein
MPGPSAAGSFDSILTGSMQVISREYREFTRMTEGKQEKMGLFVQTHRPVDWDRRDFYSRLYACLAGNGIFPVLKIP